MKSLIPELLPDIVLQGFSNLILNRPNMEQVFGDAIMYEERNLQFCREVSVGVIFIKS